MSDCDSPIALVNKTFNWIGKHLKDEIDFVVWTGDSARHDNDENFPRTAPQVIGLNEFMVEKFAETLGKHNGDEHDSDPNNDYIVPIIPTFGNNDILPHNIFTQAPNKWTRTYSKVWKQFIPEEQRHAFEQGGWFYVEVIAQKLAVFSLNTMYFFTSNAAADGCAQKSEPGYHQMEWLRIQLQFLRERGMKAILTGHVPPVRTDAKTTWDETCWQKYTLWLRQYRDVVVSSHYGHVNYDHFILQDFEDLKKGTKKGRMPDYKTRDVEDEDEMHTAVSSDYFIELRKKWAKLPQPPKSLDWPSSVLDEDDEIISLKKGKGKKSKKKKKKKKDREDFLDEIGGPYAERFALSFVAASVVPNLFPSLRVFEYNITGLDGASEAEEMVPSGPRLELRDAPSSFENVDLGEDEDLDYETAIDMAKKKKKKKKKKKHHKKKRTKFTVPDGPSKSSPPGPAYSPQTFSLLKYTQFLANLTHINNDFPIHDSDDQDVNVTKWHEGKHKGKKPHDKDYKPRPKKFGFEVQYETQEDGVYDLTDLTMPRVLDLARRIGGFKHDALFGENEDEMSEEEEEEEASDEEASYEKAGDEQLETEKKGKKKHKHKHKNKKRRRRNEAWYTFVRRAFVETLTQEEIEEQFG